MKYLKSLSILSASSLMTGCIWSIKPDFKVDQSLLVPCPPLPIIEPVNGEKVSMGELAESDIEISGMYAECKKLHDGTIESIRAYMEGK